MAKDLWQLGIWLEIEDLGCSFFEDLRYLKMSLQDQKRDYCLDAEVFEVSQKDWPFEAHRAIRKIVDDYKRHLKDAGVW